MLMLLYLCDGFNLPKNSFESTRSILGDGIIEFCSIHGIKSKFMKIIAKSDGSESESPVFDANSM